MLRVRAVECQDAWVLRNSCVYNAKKPVLAGFLQTETANNVSTFGPLTGFNSERYAHLDNSERHWPQPGGRGVYRLDTRP